MAAVSDDQTTQGGRVVDYIVEQLAERGVEFIFGVGGANIEDLYDAAHLHRHLHALLAKHEFSAAAMADGYSRGTSELGVVMATSGGGALNLVPGLGESLASRVPVLALIGQPPTSMDGRGSFQDTSGLNASLNAEELFSAVSVYCHRVTTPADILTALPRAISAAKAGGPAVLLLPKDIQQAPLVGGKSAPGDSRPHPPPTDPSLIVRALRCARGPVTIVAGEQVARADARDELERLRAVLGARIATVPDAKDVSPAGPWSLGVTGVMGHPGIAEAIAGSAVCLLVGTRLPATAGAGLAAALAGVQVVSVGSAAPYLPCTHLHTTDLRALLAELAGDVSRPDFSVPTLSTAPVAELAPPAHVGPGVRYRQAMQVLDDVLPAGVDIVVDAGNTGASAIHHLPARQAGRFVVALGMGGMGYSFGAGVGMAAGRRRRTVVIAGDGAFFMHGMEIHTALEYRLPVTFVLFNNNAHGMCVTREGLYFSGDYSYNRFRPSRLGDGLATMFPGLTAVDVTTIDALPGALDTALAVAGPSVVSVECSADEIPPFAPFLAEPTAAEAASPSSKESRNHVPARA
ncbi:MAG: thiamine pyrophosphate-binding protein [Mycobacterium sp.]